MVEHTRNARSSRPMRIWLTLCRRKQRGSAWIAPPYIPVLKDGVLRRKRITEIGGVIGEVRQVVPSHQRRLLRGIGNVVELVAINRHVGCKGVAREVGHAGEAPVGQRAADQR